MKRAIVTAAALTAAIMATPVLANGNQQLRAQVAPYVQNVNALTTSQLVQIKTIIDQDLSTLETKNRIQAIVS